MEFIFTSTEELRVNANFAYGGCDVVSMTDPYGRNHSFLYRIPYFFFQVASQLYSQSSVDPVADTSCQKIW
jgi:hypothetical protein